MSIIGALSGFAVAAFIVGSAGTIASGVSLYTAVDHKRDTRQSKIALSFFLFLLFVGSTIGGGVW